MNYEFHKDIALKYRVSNTLVGSLVKKAKTNKDFFNELRAIETDKEIIINRIKMLAI